MPAYPSSNPRQFIQGAPVLHVPDVQTAVGYYRDVLGFVSDFGDDDYAVVWRDNSAIHFVRSDRCPSGVHLFQWVRDVDACYEEIKARGAKIAAGPGDRPYGVRDFNILDLNGVSIVFGQDIEAEQVASEDASKATRL
jgi:catechol 2,3-dioxygenase-like lactoylglutathione lyase family enzyme